MVKIIIRGEQREYEKGTSFETIAKEFQKDYDTEIAVALENGKIRELFKKVTRDCTVDFFTLKDEVGHKTYIRTATTNCCCAFPSAAKRFSLQNPFTAICTISWCACL